MTSFEEIKQGMYLSGVVHGQIVEVIALIPTGADSASLYFKLSGGAPQERLIFKQDLMVIEQATIGKPWNFDADGDAFKLVLEANRINLAYLFDPMMAVHTSNVQPLPHQITAVYDAMLPKQPLRFVLADDPGAGKTIMAGLLIRELLMRAAVCRVLIVSPGSLTEQWRDELHEKFGLNFTVFNRSLCDQTHSGNPFDDYDLLIARLDQLARAEDLQAKLFQSSWDLIVVDEAHKLSASFFGNQINETQRYKLGKRLGAITQHYLLMTATPHNGKEADFQLFLALLDPDRFAGKFREGVQKIDVDSIMRRMVKEDLYTFENTHLFPERFANSVDYKLSNIERDLYEHVTHYVQEEMNRADKLNNQRKGRVGFALTGLQRRLASSPFAIYKTLGRRKRRLEQRIEDIKTNQEIEEWKVLNDDTDPDDYSSEEFEKIEEEVVDQATAASTIEELEAEILILADLEQEAHAVVQSGQDRKWEELSNLLQTNSLMKDEDGYQRKLIVFTEYKDTLSYLINRIGDVLGDPDAVVAIHGGVNREARRLAQERFRQDKQVRIMVATDAAGEGVNLQNANLMVNYDLPWNPNRIEQRFGRIHRIGQKQSCHLWNMIATETREGDVFQRLFQKINIEREALGGRVFDILGELFEEKPLKEMLIEAIRFGADPKHRDYLVKQIDTPFDKDHIQEVLRRHALCSQSMNAEQIFHVKEEMEKAEARKLQPHYICSFFSEAFKQMKGSMRKMERGRFEITHVPQSVISAGEILRKNGNPVLRRYERVCFEKEYIQITGKPSASLAELIHPGHPLMKAVLHRIMENGRSILKQGTILVDQSDEGCIPRLLFIIDHCVKSEKHPEINVSRRLHFVELLPDGTPSPSRGVAPYLAYLPLNDNDRAYATELLSEHFIRNWGEQRFEQVAIEYASSNIISEHYQEVRNNRCAQADKIRAEVRARLVQEIDYQSSLLDKFEEQAEQGKDMDLPIRDCRKRIKEYNERLHFRMEELDDMSRVVSSTPSILGGALIIPEGWLERRRSKTTTKVEFCPDAEARKRIEKIAMKAVLETEEAMGNKCIDVSAQNCGWDITSQSPMLPDGSIPTERHIEVKGRCVGSKTITVTCNEICTALNQGDKFWLAVVYVDSDGTVDGPHYLHHPFQQAPTWGVASVNYDLNLLFSKAK